MQEFMIVFNTKSGDETIHHFTDSNTLLAKETIVPGTLHSQCWIDHLGLDKLSQHAACCFKIGLLAKALQHFGQNQVTNQNGNLIQNAIQELGLGRFRAIEVVYPDG